MSAWLRIVVIGAVSILAFDLVAAVASRVTGFPYIYATVGSWLIYLGVGYLAVRATGSVGRAALATGMVGLVEATLGWALSRMIGPVLPPPETGAEEFPLAVAVVATVVLVVATASALGAIGGLIGRGRAQRVVPIE